MYANFRLYNQFFDRRRVIDEVGRKRVKSLSRLGAFIRRRARQSMRTAPPTGNVTASGRKRRKGRQLYSAAGQPPFAREGSIKRFLFFVWDAATQSMVVGPAIKNAIKREVGPGTPALMEYGGVVYRRGKRVIYQPRPFMEPAFEAEMRNALNYWNE